MRRTRASVAETHGLAINPIRTMRRLDAVTRTHIVASLIRDPLRTVTTRELTGIAE